MKTEFSNRMKDVFTYVREEVIRLGSESVGVEHLFLGILREGEGTAIRVLKDLGVNTKDLRLIIENKITSDDKKEDKLKITFKDNIGIAEKINNEIPDKIWPTKIRDINFLILKSYIMNGKAFIKISSIPNESKIKLSSFEFTNVGNDKKFQHYKSALEIMLFDIMGRVKDFDKRRILEKAYNL